MGRTTAGAARSGCPAACWLLVLVLSNALLAQPRPGEYDVKLAFLYNFLKYVQWPAGAEAGPLVVCVAGHNPFGPAWNDVLQNELVNGRRVRPRVVLGADEVVDESETCHVLFIPRTANRSAFLGAADKAPILVVGETEDFVEAGGTIRFLTVGTRVRFEIDVERAKRAGLSMAPDLLRLRWQPGTGGAK